MPWLWGWRLVPAAGLELADRLISEPALEKYHLLPSVRADLLKKLGRLEEARAEFERAAAMTRNVRERALLLDRAKPASQTEHVLCGAGTLSAAFELDLAFFGETINKDRRQRRRTGVSAPHIHTMPQGLERLASACGLEILRIRFAPLSRRFRWRPFEGQSHSVTILLWIVEIRDRACGQVSADARVIWLPASVVAFADHGSGDRVQNSRSLAAGAFVEITRILFQNGWQDGAADKRAGNEVGVRGAVTLAISLCALTISTELILGLLSPRDDAYQSRS